MGTEHLKVAVENLTAACNPDDFAFETTPELGAGGGVDRPLVGRSVEHADGQVVRVGSCRLWRLDGDTHSRKG
ncbi:MAG TPA: hypothetical protein DCP37_02580 [Dehalococcoidia bacterium]|nr:hypothetical protein [Dehalococcoidia bacterium]